MHNKRTVQVKAFENNRIEERIENNRQKKFNRMVTKVQCKKEYD